MMTTNYRDGNGTNSLEDDRNDADDDANDEGLPCCAICWEPESDKRRLTYLPCCGVNGKEETTTTRFCESCISTELKRQGSDNISPRRGFFYQDEAIGECPRCKRLLVLMRKERKSRRQRASPASIGLRLASFFQTFWYALDKDVVTYGYALVIITGCHFSYIPRHAFPLLVKKHAWAFNLVAWGLLQRGSSDIVYTMSATDQNLLRKWCTKYLTVESKEGQRTGIITLRSNNADPGNNELSSFVQYWMSIGSILAVSDLQFGCAARLSNRAIVLLLVRWGFLPPLTDWKETNHGNNPAVYLLWNNAGWPVIVFILILLHLLPCSVMLLLLRVAAIVTGCQAAYNVSYMSRAYQVKVAFMLIMAAALLV